MRLILDAVLNHVRTASLVSGAAREKPYKDSSRSPSPVNTNVGAAIAHAELNLSNESLQKLLFRGKNSVLQKYLEMEWTAGAST